MKCPFRKIEATSTERIETMDGDIRKTNSTVEYQECYGTICPWFVSLKTPEGITGASIPEHCGQCK